MLAQQHIHVMDDTHLKVLKQTHADIKDLTDLKDLKVL